jgi:hypothetical protein
MEVGIVGETTEAVGSLFNVSVSMPRLDLWGY